PQLTVFALELLEPLTLLARQTRPLPRIPLAPPNPAAQRLGRTADLLCDRLDRRPFRFILVRVLADQPNRPLPHLRRVLLCSCHGSNFSRDGASGKLGAIQLANGAWHPAYRQAKRAVPPFDLELGRLTRQCAMRGAPQAKSGDELVDGYILHYMLGQTLQPADEAELRNRARLMVDSKLSDRKKQILMLQRAGFNQSDIARRLGIERQ